MTLIDGEPVPIIDGLVLFARHGREIRAETPLTCRLPADDEWSKAMLQPLVEAAGYRIAAPSDDAADVTIVMDDAAVPQNDTAIIRLHSDADQPESASGGIYRYNHGALLGALKQARAGRSR